MSVQSTESARICMLTALENRLHIAQLRLSAETASLGFRFGVRSHRLFLVSV